MPGQCPWSGRAGPRLLSQSLLLNQLSVPCRPARMVPSITHGLILAPLASSRRKKEASSPPRARASAPTWPPPWSSAQLSGCPGHPSSEHCLVCFSGPRREGRGERKGRQLGKGEKGGRGGASISNFIINTLFCKVGACFCFCTQLSGQSFLCAEGGSGLNSPYPAHSFLEVPALPSQRSVWTGPCEEQKDSDCLHVHHQLFRSTPFVSNCLKK